MNRNICARRSIIALLLVILVGTLWMGCSSTVKERRGEPGQVEGKEMGRPDGKYYFFDDVFVPAGMKYKAGRSFVYETPRFKAGILVFSQWWLDPNSLVDFFTYNMEKDNWKLVNSFKGKEAILNFTKPDKSCAIKISERWYGTTEAEIRVGPLGDKKM